MGEFSIRRLSWSLSHFFMSALFAYSARVQLNDPDWQLWFCAYAFASVLCIQLAAACFVPLPAPLFPGTSPSSVAGALSIVAASAMILHFAREKAVDFSVRTEVGREAGGLLIMAAWMSFSSRRSPDAGKMSASTQQLPKPSRWGVLLYLLLPAVSSAVMLSAYYVPTYFLDAEDATDHCTGLGFDASPSQ